MTLEEAEEKLAERLKEIAGADAEMQMVRDETQVLRDEAANITSDAYATRDALLLEIEELTSMRDRLKKEVAALTAEVNTAVA